MSLIKIIEDAKVGQLMIFYFLDIGLEVGEDGVGCSNL